MLNFIIENAATIATLFFFGAFCYIFFSTFKKSKKKEFDKLARIPLDDEKNS